MRLSEVLNYVPDTSTRQVENFLGSRVLRPGTHRNVRVGTAIRNRHCQECSDTRTFASKSELSCLVTGEKALSIDTLMTCTVCKGEGVVAWFLVRSINDLFSPSPKVFVERFTEYRRASTGITTLDSDPLDDLLMRARAAHGSGLGAGSIIYLRKAFEIITTETAKAVDIDLKTAKGRSKPFQKLLQEVHDAVPLIPEEFASGGYTLFRELSGIIHGDTDEATALKKFAPCYALVLGIIEKARNRQVFEDAIIELGWTHNESGLAVVRA